ncbi:MAG: acyl-CoA thioesterase [Anaerolineae bacterium]|nr:acyl-CoA thioesterase [Anaerolineae bacterium]
MEGFRYQIPIEVRFADLDVLGHLNNAKYLTYIEQARIVYVRDVCGWEGDWRELGMILARTEIDYKLPIDFKDKATVYIRVSRLGGKSFDMEYVITRQHGDAAEEIAANVKTVMVAYDYQQDTSIPVPASWRERILAYEPALTEA